MVADPGVSERLTGVVDDIDDTIRQIRSSIFELNDPADAEDRSLRPLFSRSSLRSSPCSGSGPR